MRWTLFGLVALCLPLSAGDLAVLPRIVRDFGSDEFEVRQRASKTLRRYLKTELAPLLEAMRANDPEVARRAREAVAGLLPEGHFASSSAEPAMAPGQFAVVARVVNVNRQNPRIFIRGAARGQILLLGNEQAAGVKRIKAFGLQGYACQDPMMRRQLGLAAGRGYVVTSARKGSAAAQLGIEVHDIVLRIDGRPVLSAKSVGKALANQPDWPKLQVVVLRDGKPKTLP